ncbi:MAG: DUF1653 domain-containing protein [Bacillota bacterium]|nr:DUF1653 domain-containing protein [Bacillota bacterium]
MLNKPLPQQIYRHFKGNLYRIVTLAKHSETGEELVIYQALYGDYQVYARPLPMFFQKVDREKYPDAPQEYRFELVKELLPVPNMLQPIETAGRETVSQQSDGQTAEMSGKEPSGQFGIPQVEQPKMQETEQSIEQEEINIDPLVLEFLDADSYEERLNILAALHHRITDEMINTMAVSVDLEVKEGDTQERYEELKNCLLTLEKYECNRLR